MDNLKKYIIISSIVLLVLFIIMPFFRKKDSNPQFDQEISLDGEVKSEIEGKKVSGYHLVTYNQAANSNSFIKDLKITSLNEGNIRFVIGSLDEDNFINERTEFRVDCREGENELNLLGNRYIVKQGEYLFMDLSGQNFVYEKEDSKVKSLIQTQSKKITGKMQFQESNYILPYEYTLEKIEEYNCLVLGNEITSNYTGIGFGATEEKLDYYNLTKSRLENTFNRLNMSNISITSWEKAETENDRLEWLSQNLSEKYLNNIDLVIFQFGDKFNAKSDLENSVKNIVEFIKKYSPNVEMIFIGPWFNYENGYRKIPMICDKFEISFIDVSDLSRQDEYKTPVEIETLDINNQLQLEVMYYPNNEAMQIISNRIIEKLGFNIY